MNDKNEVTWASVDWIVPVQDNCWKSVVGIIGNHVVVDCIPVGCAINGKWHEA